MRRLATGVLVAGLLVLGLAAAVDALRGQGERPRPSERSAPPRAATGDRSAVAALELAGVRGTITYSDRQCRLHAVRLPTLEAAPAPGYERCTPHIPSRGFAVADGEVVWSGLGFRTAQTVLSRAELTAAVRRHPQAVGPPWTGAGRYEAVRLVALGANRLAVVLVNPHADWERPLLATFEDGRLASLRVGVAGSRDRIRPSPRGRYLAVLHPLAGVEIYKADGDRVQLPSVTNPHAVAWSPDDEWTALATRYSVYVFPSDRPQETIRIPLAVRDLDWGT
jgi:hypothetical protein